MSVLGHARLHAYTILLWVSAFIWMSLPYNNGLDMTIHKWTQLFNIALPEDAKPASDSILFIDVSASRYLVPLNEEGSENDVITNRKYLTALFEYIYQHKTMSGTFLPMLFLMYLPPMIAAWLQRFINWGINFWLLTVIPAILYNLIY